MARWILLAAVAFFVAVGCTQEAATTSPATGKQAPKPTEEGGKTQPTTSNQELTLNPNAANVNQAGSALKGKN